ncbi:hypothetical protein ANTPLA_LOCUS8125 [Anthophora plagiata]
MEKVLSNLIWRICLVFLDDIIIYRKIFEEELKNLKKVFSRLRRAGTLMTPKECERFLPSRGEIPGTHGFRARGEDEPTEDFSSSRLARPGE